LSTRSDFKRVSGSNTFCPHELSLLKVIEGGYDIEKEWHRRSSTCAGTGSGSGLHLNSWKRWKVRLPIPSTCPRRHQSENCAVSARALEDRARRKDASVRMILQGSAELSRVRRHRETIGVLIHRLIDARGLA
jgi:hypothetical protein